MDIFEFRAKRVVDTEGVFDSNPMAIGSDVSGLFIRLKNLMISEVHTQWDIAFLDTYIKSAMVPRSLRWEVTPQKGEPNLDGWYKYFNDAGVDFLRFLVQRKGEKLIRLDEEIKLFKEKLLPFNNEDDYREGSKSLLKTLKKRKRTKNLKRRKSTSGKQRIINPVMYSLGRKSWPLGTRDPILWIPRPRVHHLGEEVLILHPPSRGGCLIIHQGGTLHKTKTQIIANVNPLIKVWSSPPPGGQDRAIGLGPPGIFHRKAGRMT